jgi:hypothetical protein
MNDPVINRLNSVKACITVANLPVHQPVWNGQPPLAFQEDLSTLTTQYNAAAEIAARATTAAKGNALAKEAAEDFLENTSYKAARALHGHFKKTGDPARRAKVDHKLSYYQRLRDQDLIAASAELIGIANTTLNEPGAAERGLTPDLVAQLQSAHASFVTHDSAPRAGIHCTARGATVQIRFLCWIQIFTANPVVAGGHG